MAQYFVIHPTHPQKRLIAQAAKLLRDGGLIAYPTDSCYALGCHTGDKDAMERMRRVRGMDESRHLTLMCRDLAEVATFARVDNARFKFLKSLTPGSYTFILEGTRELPRRILHPRRKTIGVRISGHPVVRALLEELGEPLLSATAMPPGPPGESEPFEEAADIRSRFEHDLALVLDGGHCGSMPTTVIDLTGDEARVLRAGLGPVDLPVENP
jgi:tRNA threonylcarbamoyl adenosine modification protein (Sua5/YciO/YrdC/YwlC family)